MRLVGLTIALFAFLGGAGTAMAETDAYSYSIYGSGTNRIVAPTDVAVDGSAGPSSHDVYVAEPRERRVQKFDGSGNFILSVGPGVDKTDHGDVCTAASGDECGQGTWAGSEKLFSSPDRVAVDGSSGPSAGDLYVLDGNRIMKFSPGGQVLTAWADEGTLQFATTVSAISVDQNGQLLVLDTRNFPVLHVYTQDGVEVSDVSTSVNSAYGGLAPAPGGDFFVTTGGTTPGVAKLDAAGASLGAIEGLSGSSSLTADLSANALYVGTGEGKVARFAADCAPATCTPDAAFGQGYLQENSGRHGIAVDTESKAVYVTESAEGGYYSAGEVEAFLPEARLPIVTTEPQPILSKDTATFVGSVDPNGLGPVDSCDFEYVRQEEYIAGHFASAKTLPCQPHGAYTSPGLATARLSGLSPGDVIHYRLAAGNATARAAGRPQVVTAEPKPTAETGVADTIGDTTARLTGSVSDSSAGGIESCYFELIEVGEPGSPPISAPCSPTPPYKGNFTLPVHVTAAGLKPETRYTYRLVVENDEWRGEGEKITFSTHQSPIVSDPEGEELEPIHPHHPVHCSKHACTVTLHATKRPQAWASPKFPPSYGWLFTLKRSGEKLSHSGLRGGCHASFGGRGIKAQLNACPNRFQLTYRGSGTFEVHWRVFEQCRCTNVNHRPRR